MLNIEVHQHSSPIKCNYKKRLAIHLKYLTGLKRIMYINSSVNCAGVRNKEYIFISVPWV